MSLLVISAGTVLAQQKPVPGSPAVETIEQANQKIRLLAASVVPAAQPGEYDLGPGDTIKVDVFDIPELSRQMQIDPAGYISVPLIPQRIQAAGLTPYQLEARIADLLESRGLVSHPQVSVFVVERLSQPVTVIGAVEHPLVYQAQRPTTLLEVLSAAGGLTDTAGDYLTITHSDKSGQEDVQRVNLQDLIDRGDPKANVMVSGGDVVTVPKAGIVYVVGAVNRSGGFVMQNQGSDMTTLKALALAGGLVGSARAGSAVIIRKNGATGKNAEIVVNLKKILSRKTQDVELLPNDILFIPDSPGKRALARAGEAALSITTGVTVLRAAQF
ncbi:MAG TPA: polysaccharide biosynthesis/export family protein [Candidatus Acidoferrales bacterium]|nr:polysaccharide biosynthesis/export family protein [Candidatus Acidoferrales bacterium]